MDLFENTASLTEDLSRVREREQVLSARYFGALRLCVASATTLSFAVFGRLVGVAHLRGADALFAVYTLAAAIVLRQSGRGPRWAQAAGFAVPCLDVPFTAALVFVLRDGTSAIGELIFFNAAFLVLLIAAASLWITPRLVYATALAAAAAEVIIQRACGVASHVLASTLILFGASAALSAFVIHRNMALAAASAHELERRREAEVVLRAARDAAEEAVKVKSQFLTNMSHEVRTPMNGVVGMTSLLLESPLNPEQRELARMARSSATALLAILDSILDVSEAGSRLDVAACEPFDPRELFSECVSLLSSEAKGKGLAIVIAVDESVPQRLCGAPGRLRLVLLNVLGNAVKFTDAGTVTLRASIDADAMLRVEVEDTGIGIAPEMRQRLFGAFSQADGSMTRRHGGVGLGLAISRKLVGSMAGTIDFTSVVGRGTTFWFTARAQPVRALAADTHPLVAEPPPSTEPSRLSGRVLVVEDNPVNQLITARMLTRMGFEVDVANNGVEALAAMTCPYDVILMDCQMPEMDGYEATAEIRRREGVARRTPIIAVTAHSTQGDRERCLDSGMDDFLTKPVQAATLRATLSKYLAR